MLDLAQTVRNKATNEEIELGFLLSCLGQAKHPNDQITRLVEAKVLLRIKQGLYVFGPKYQRKLIVKETLANQIYGPSYVSLEHAMSHYGLIPERVETVTSITTKRRKTFHTPIGTFSYATVPVTAYASGIRQLYLDDTHPVLMASLEKAILDKFWMTRGSEIYNAKDFREFLYDDQRFDEHVLRTVRPRVLMAHAKTYQRVRMLKWATWLKEELA